MNLKAFAITDVRISIVQYSSLRLGSYILPVSSLKMKHYTWRTFIPTPPRVCKWSWYWGDTWSYGQKENPDFLYPPCLSLTYNNLFPHLEFLFSNSFQLVCRLKCLNGYYYYNFSKECYQLFNGNYFLNIWVCIFSRTISNMYKVIAF